MEGALARDGDGFAILAALVQEWPDLNRLAKLTAPSPLHLRMQRILRPIEAADPKVIRMGPHVTIRFGQ